jgi:very-short-patch-repair endonuclease
MKYFLSNNNTPYSLLELVHLLHEKQIQPNTLVRHFQNTDTVEFLIKKRLAELDRNISPRQRAYLRFIGYRGEIDFSPDILSNIIDCTKNKFSPSKTFEEYLIECEQNNYEYWLSILQKYDSAPENQNRTETLDTFVFGDFLPKKIQTENEIAFFNILKKLFPDNYIAVQVCMSALISASDYKNRSQFRSYYVDFVICDQNAENALLIIELDDSSHNKEKRIQQDNRKNSVIAAANIPFVRYLAKRNYNIKEVAATLSPYITINPVPRPRSVSSPPVSPSLSSPHNSPPLPVSASLSSPCDYTPPDLNIIPKFVEKIRKLNKDDPVACLILFLSVILILALIFLFFSFIF